MSITPAAHFLVDFASKDLKLETAREVTREGASEASDSDWEARIEAAHARGMEEGREAAEAEAAARLGELQGASEQSLAAAREAWCADEGPKLAGQIASAMHDIEDRIAQSAERVLRPFVAEAVREQAVTRLRAVVRDLVATNPGLTLEISGPEDLLESVRSSLSASVATVSYVANDACDVQVKGGGSVIETRIAAWLAACEGRLP